MSQLFCFIIHLIEKTTQLRKKGSNYPFEIVGNCLVPHLVPEQSQQSPPLLRRIARRCSMFDGLREHIPADNSGHGRRTRNASDIVERTEYNDTPDSSRRFAKTLPHI